MTEPASSVSSANDGGSLPVSLPEESSARGCLRLDCSTVVKTVTAGASVLFMWGPQIAICSAVATFIFAQIEKQPQEKHWFSCGYICHDIKKVPEWIPKIIKIHFVVFAIQVLIAPSNQLIAKAVERGISNNPEMVWHIVALIALIGPLIEEVVFRGVIQEGIKTFQAKILKQDEDSGASKVQRIIAQAGFFAYIHVHLAQSLGNIPILFSTFAGGCAYGCLKEESQTLWSSWALHSMGNAWAVMGIALRTIAV